MLHDLNLNSQVRDVLGNVAFRRVIPDVAIPSGKVSVDEDFAV